MPSRVMTDMDPSLRWGDVLGEGRRRNRAEAIVEAVREAKGRLMPG
jgi:hypothetical protein